MADPTALLRLDPRFLYPHPMIAKLAHFQAVGPSLGIVPMPQMMISPTETLTQEPHVDPPREEGTWSFHIPRRARSTVKRRRRNFLEALWFLVNSDDEDDGDASEVKHEEADEDAADDDGDEEKMVAEALFNMANMGSRLQDEDEEDGEGPAQEGEEEEEPSPGRGMRLRSRSGPRMQQSRHHHAERVSGRRRRRSPGDEDPDYDDEHVEHDDEGLLSWRGRGRGPRHRPGRAAAHEGGDGEAMSGEEGDWPSGPRGGGATAAARDAAAGGRAGGRAQALVKPEGDSSSPEAAARGRGRGEGAVGEDAATSPSAGTTAAAGAHGARGAAQAGGGRGRAARGFEPPSGAKQQQQQAAAGRPGPAPSSRATFLPPPLSAWGMPMPMPGAAGMPMVNSALVARFLGQREPGSSAQTAAAGTPGTDQSHAAAGMDAACAGATGETLASMVGRSHCALHVRIAHLIFRQQQQQQRVAASGAQRMPEEGAGIGVGVGVRVGPTTGGSGRSNAAAGVDDGAERGRQPGARAEGAAQQPKKQQQQQQQDGDGASVVKLGDGAAATAGVPGSDRRASDRERPAAALSPSAREAGQREKEAPAAGARTTPGAPASTPGPGEKHGGQKPVSLASGPPTPTPQQQQQVGGMAMQGMAGMGGSGGGAALAHSFPFALPPQMMLVGQPQQQPGSTGLIRQGSGTQSINNMAPVVLPLGAMGPRPGAGPRGAPGFSAPFMMTPGSPFPFAFPGMSFHPPGVVMPPAAPSGVGSSGSSSSSAAAHAAGAGAGGMGMVAGLGSFMAPFPFAGMQWPVDAEQLARMQGVGSILTALGNQQEAARRAAEARRT